MAYTSRYRRGRRGYRRRYRKYKKSSGTNWVGIAKKAYKTAKFVAGIVNAEKKFNDFTWNNQNLDNSGYIRQCANLIPQGDDENNRSGRSIKACSIQFRLTATLQGSAQAGVVRAVLIRDKAAAGVLPDPADIFTNVTGELAVTSYRNIFTGAAERYDILMDKRCSMDTYKNEKCIIQGYRKLNSHIHYIGTADTIANVGNGTLYLFLISTGVTASSTGVVINGQMRLRYYDN